MSCPPPPAHLPRAQPCNANGSRWAPPAVRAKRLLGYPPLVLEIWNEKQILPGDPFINVSTELNTRNKLTFKSSKKHPPNVLTRDSEAESEWTTSRAVDSRCTRHPPLCPPSPSQHRRLHSSFMKHPNVPVGKYINMKQMQMWHLPLESCRILYSPS